MNFETIYGIYDLLSSPYVALVTESEPFFTTSHGINMRRVKKVKIVPLFQNTRQLSHTKQRDEDQYIQLLHRAFTLHSFFFSNTFDVTLTQQRQAQLTMRQGKDPLWARADHRFFWNREVVTDLIAIEADEWITPFMSAYVEIRPDCEIDGDTFTLLFISRRSKYRQGCRYTRRGLDDRGNVANFVETEQILLHGDGKITSFVQVRGSIPLYWSSPVTMKYEPRVYIDDDRAKRTESCEKHVSDLLQQYVDNSNASSVIFVNLIDNKKDQQKLGVAFKEVVDDVKKKVDKVKANSLTYVWFDFHHETKQKGKWNNLSKLLSRVDDIFRQQRFFCKLPSGAVTSWQVGVIRTNCMDNLDRTNVVQSLFARRSLLMQVGKDALLDANVTNNRIVLDTPYKNFEKIYKSIWANNADAISRMYAGTGALKVDFTKTGKRTFQGLFNDGVNSAKRYYINNFTDGVKQDAIDLMLGNYHPDISAQSPFMTRPGQESIGLNIIKSFVLLVLIFSTLLLFSTLHWPTNLLVYVNSFTERKGGLIMSNLMCTAINSHLNQLQSKLLVSLAITACVVLYAIHMVVKKGSKIGERMVIIPCLIPDEYNVRR